MLTEQEINNTLDTMLGLVGKEQTFEWPGGLHVVTDENRVQLSKPLARSYVNSFVAREDFVTIHDAWIKLTAQQVLVNALLARITQYRVEMNSGTMIWPVDAVEEFKKYIISLK